MSAQERLARLASESMHLTGGEEIIDTTRFTIADGRAAILRVVNNVLAYNQSVRQQGFEGSYWDFVHQTRGTHFEL